MFKIDKENLVNNVDNAKMENFKFAKWYCLMLLMFGSKKLGYKVDIAKIMTGHEYSWSVGYYYAISFFVK